jgi:hypothetical protein
MKFKTFLKLHSGFKLKGRYTNSTFHEKFNILSFDGDNFKFNWKGRTYTLLGCSRFFKSWEESGSPLGENNITFRYLCTGGKTVWIVEFEQQQKKEQIDMFKSINMDAIKKKAEVRNKLMLSPQIIHPKALPEQGEISFKMLPQGDFIETNIHFVQGRGLVMCSNEDCFHCKTKKAQNIYIWQCYIVYSDNPNIKVGYTYPIGFTIFQIKDMIERVEKYGDITSLENGLVSTLVRYGNTVKFQWDEEHSKPTIQELGIDIAEVKLASAEQILNSITK